MHAVSRMDWKNRFRCNLNSGLYKSTLNRINAIETNRIRESRKCITVRVKVSFLSKHGCVLADSSIRKESKFAEKQRAKEIQHNNINIGRWGVFVIVGIDGGCRSIGAVVYTHHFLSHWAQCLNARTHGILRMKTRTSSMEIRSEELKSQRAHSLSASYFRFAT